MGMWIAILFCGMAAGLLIARAYYRAEIMFLRMDGEDMQAERNRYREQLDMCRKKLQVKSELAEALRRNLMTVHDHVVSATGSLDDPA